MSLESINNDKVRIKEIYPHIYHIEFKSQYDLAMHFIRFQEYYESPKFHQQIFTLVDYMEWYVEEYNKNKYVQAFTYPIDWGGFNVPSRCLLPFIAEPCPIPDLNKYDIFMLNVIKILKNKENEQDFYLIGTEWTDDTDNDTLNHELSHAWYTVDMDYRQKMDSLLNDIPTEILVKARNHLMNNNYHNSTIDDEIIAYSATGLNLLQHIIPADIADPFKKFFNLQLDKVNS